MKTLREYIDLITETITDDWFSTGAFETFKKLTEEKYEIAQEDGAIDTLEGPVNYKKGYYILTGPKGERYPIPPEKFAELKDDQGHGICTPKKILKDRKSTRLNSSH